MVFSCVFFPAHTAANSLSFHASGNYLLTGSDDGQLKVFGYSKLNFD